ncbi:nucleolar protein dao-5 [Anopheles cruzii]|uniref:nucleolar protein dao-5 n=1 Tax=Anopheles cruzii TaxID=68878 RepID=UPI0022EC97AD|nr:nucleolar protein dao-5 [Anopheles cruzii]
MSESNAKPVEEMSASEVKTPTKRTPKRKAEAFQKESEALLKNLGVTVDLDDGRRRTRSSSRAVTATPPTTPATPPAKRARGAATQSKSPSPASDEAQKSKATPKKREHVVEPRKIVLQKDQPTAESQPEANTSSTSSAPAAAENSVEKMDVSTVQQQAKFGKPEGQVASDVVEEKKVDDTKLREVNTKDEADATSTTTEALSAEAKKDEEHQKDAAPQKKNDEPPAVDGVKASVVSAAEEPMEVDGGSGEKAVASSKAKANVTAAPVRVESTDSSATEETHENSTDSAKQEDRPKDSNATTVGVTKEEVKVVETKVATATNVVESNGEVVSHPEDTVVKTVTSTAEVVDGPEKKEEEPAAPAVGKEPPAENIKAVSVPVAAPVDVTSSTVVEIDDNSSNEDTVPVVKSVDVDCAPKENNVADKVNSNVEPKIVASEPTAVEAAPAAP